MSNPPKREVYQKPIVFPPERLASAQNALGEILTKLSRTYLCIIQEFSEHEKPQSDQKFFVWLQSMLMSFLDNQLDKRDLSLVGAVHMELCRIFQGDRFNQEAKKPEQVARIFSGKKLKQLRRFECHQICPPLSSEIGRNSPIVAHILPSSQMRIKSFMKELDDKMLAERNRKMIRSGLGLGLGLGLGHILDVSMLWI